MSNIQTGLILLAVVLSGVSVILSRKSPVSGSDNTALLESLRGELKALEDRFIGEQDRTRESLRAMQTESFQYVQDRIDKLNAMASEEARLSRQDAANGRQELEQRVTTTLDGVKLEVKNQGETNERRLTEIKGTMQQEMEKLRAGNEEKLEKMRETVDEKLQGTLDARHNTILQASKRSSRSSTNGLR
jgi:DNA recombination protein RmuC